MNRYFLSTVVLTSAVISITLAPTSLFAGGCYNNSCLGKDPVEMSCGRTSTRHEITSPSGYRVQLRYSAECNAMWARVLADEYNLNRNSTFAQIYGFSSSRRARDFKENVSSGRSSGHLYRYSSQLGFSIGSYWTEMIPNSYWARACVNDVWSTALPRNPYQECTERG